MPLYKEQTFDVDALRKDVLHRLMQSCTLVGTVLYVWTMYNYRSVLAISITYTVIYLAYLIVALYPGITHKFRTFTVVSVLMSIGFIEFLRYGPSGDGMAFVLSSIAFISLLVSAKAGYLSILISVIILNAFALLRLNGDYEFHGIYVAQGEIYTQWISAILELVLFATALNYLISTMFTRMAKGLQELERSETRYRLLEDNVHDVIWAMDMDYRIEYVTPSVKQYLGKSPAEIVGKDFGTVVSEEYKQNLKGHVATIQDKEDPIHHVERFEVALSHIEGYKVPTETVVAVLYDPSGKPYWILGVTRNIKERIELDKERQALAAQLYQSQKMESIGMLTGGIAHDFNNLLQVIIGFGELAQVNTRKGISIDNELKQVLGAGEKAKMLIRQLLAFSRQQVLELKDLNINEVVNDIAKMIGRVIGEHIEFKSILSNNIGMIQADKGQIEQVLMNLCVNARDAMGDSGTLTIETNNVSLDDDFCKRYDWAIPGEYVQLTVTDTGCGMDDETQQKVFEPFYTTKEQGKGTGLGLSTAFGIVKQHEGMIIIYSEIGIGTAFNIYFPRCHVSEISQELTAAPVEAYRGSETILLADDDDMVRNVAKSILIEAGYTVLLANDGRMAIDMYDANVDTIDFALLDIVMPNLGGKSVAEHIHKQDQQLPILFCCGYSEETLHDSFITDKNSQLLKKPYHRDELLSKIQSMLN